MLGKWMWAGMGGGVGGWRRGAMCVCVLWMGGGERGRAWLCVCVCVCVCVLTGMVWLALC